MESGGFCEVALTQGRGRRRRDTAEPALAISRQVLLQPLQQRHEIPDGEDMIFHEPPHILDGRDLRVYGVVQQLLAKGDERSNDPVLACLTLALERE